MSQALGTCWDRGEGGRSDSGGDSYDDVITLLPQKNELIKAEICLQDNDHLESGNVLITEIFIA